MANRQVSREAMLERVAVFRSLSPGKRPPVDAVLPQFRREIVNIIGGGVTEDPTMQVGIRAVAGFRMAIIRVQPGKGTGLHNHKRVEVFMSLTGRWSVRWGDAGENELALDRYDVISVPVGGTDPGKVDWAETVRSATHARGFDVDERSRIIAVATP